MFPPVPSAAAVSLTAQCLAHWKRRARCRVDAPFLYCLKIHCVHARAWASGALFGARTAIPAAAARELRGYAGTLSQALPRNLRFLGFSFCCRAFGRGCVSSETSVRIQAITIMAQNPAQRERCLGGRLKARPPRRRAGAFKRGSNWMQTQFAYMRELRISTEASAYSFSRA